MHRLELKIIPLFVFLAAAVVVLWSYLAFPLVMVETWFFDMMAVVCFCASGYLGLSALWRFHQANTTVHPGDPTKVKVMVKSGVYRFSRNPMYLGLLLLLFCESFILGNMSSAIGIVLFILYMNRFQIQPEEKALLERFGDEYLNYKAKVRRWI